MLFNSIEFGIFLPTVFLLYWFLFNKNLRLQNLFIVVASFIFYGWWDYRFLSLLIISSSVDYFVGLYLEKSKDKKRRRILLLISISTNLCILGFFKYYNFFVQSMVDTFLLFGHRFQFQTMNIILPVGISFYTFQALSYTIDVYRNNLKPTKDIIEFMAFISFFPQLVAGPIERATNLLPQFYKKRKFCYDKSVDGLRQILWGFFKKVVIADNCAVFVDNIFRNYQNFSGSTLLIGVFFFAFQIYGDFSGYSDIAIGTARLFGFDIMKNFSFPYFSRDIAEFWRRWHISLSTWFRDYVYIPLGGSNCSKIKQLRNTFVVFLVSGFWHGSKWTFIVWGFLNAIYFLPLMLLKINRKNVDIPAKGRYFPSLRVLIQILTTFLFTNFAWIFFRSKSVFTALDFIKHMFSKSFLNIPEFDVKTSSFIFFLIIVEWIRRDRNHAMEFQKQKLPFLRWAVYFGMILIIFFFSGRQQAFIYFQF